MRIACCRPSADVRSSALRRESSRDPAATAAVGARHHSAALYWLGCCHALPSRADSAAGLQRPLLCLNRRCVPTARDVSSPCRTVDLHPHLPGRLSKSSQDHRTPTRLTLDYAHARAEWTMSTTMHATPLFDPAVFIDPQPSCRPALFDDTPYSSSSSSSLARTASSSRSSLSSVSSSADEDDEDGERRHCLDLLDQLQSEVVRLNGQHASAGSRSSRERKGAHCGVREPRPREVDPSSESAIPHA